MGLKTPEVLDIKNSGCGQQEEKKDPRQVGRCRVHSWPLCKESACTECTCVLAWPGKVSQKLPPGTRETQAPLWEPQMKAGAGRSDGCLLLSSLHNTHSSLHEN